jgi:branched-chain amino acid transport system ATP-binding protein
MIEASALAGAPPAAPAVMLRAVNLTRRFGGLAAVNRVSIDLRRGEVHAVIGTNGAGKSTLVNMLSGELAPSDGAIQLGAADITGWSQPRRARAGIGRSYQRTWALWESARGCMHSGRSAAEAIAAAGLADHAATPAGSLSHGGKRQLEIAMCLATRPQVLLLDEPLAGMGAEETDRMLALLATLKRDHAVLLIEHDMDAVFRIADRITVMVNGEVIATDRPAAIRADPQVRTAYLGEDA